mmetsp:Transcript_38289/g.120550  ORF Transcript_38289/g.120550 Transcript_38289/m.120550 type:complete len:207 (-) Transcript_38289:4-624(-)
MSAIRTTPSGMAAHRQLFLASFAFHVIQPDSSRSSADSSHSLCSMCRVTQGGADHPRVRVVETIIADTSPVILVQHLQSACSVIALRESDDSIVTVGAQVGVERGQRWLSDAVKVRAWLSPLSTQLSFLSRGSGRALRSSRSILTSWSSRTDGTSGATLSSHALRSRRPDSSQHPVPSRSSRGPGETGLTRLAPPSLGPPGRPLFD